MCLCNRLPSQYGHPPWQRHDLAIALPLVYSLFFVLLIVFTVSLRWFVLAHTPLYTYYRHCQGGFATFFQNNRKCLVLKGLE